MYVCWKHNTMRYRRDKPCILYTVTSATFTPSRTIETCGIVRAKTPSLVRGFHCFYGRSQDSTVTPERQSAPRERPTLSTARAFPKNRHEGEFQTDLFQFSGTKFMGEGTIEDSPSLVRKYRAIGFLRYFLVVFWSIVQKESDLFDKRKKTFFFLLLFLTFFIFFLFMFESCALTKSNSKILSRG